MSNLSEGGAVLGSIEVKSNQLVVTANSRQRAERAKAMIGAALAGLIAVPTLEAATPEEVLEKDEPTTEPSAEDARFVAIAPDVKRRIIHCQLDEHYRRNSRQATCHFGRIRLRGKPPKQPPPAATRLRRDSNIWKTDRIIGGVMTIPSPPTISPGSGANLASRSGVCEYAVEYVLVMGALRR